MSVVNWFKLRARNFWNKLPYSTSLYRRHGNFKQHLLAGGKQLVSIVPFLILSLTLGIRGWNLPLDRYGPTFITINVTIAIFAVNFSFLEYQFSPYRTLLKSVSKRQITYSLGILLLAFIPLLILVLDSNKAPVCALLNIPLVACASFLLGSTARREINPSVYLQRQCSRTSIQAFLYKFSREVEAYLQQFEQMELSELKDRPPHEWFEPQIPSNSPVDDPFNLLVGLGHAAIHSSDVYTFENVTKSALDAFAVCKEYKYKNLLDHNDTLIATKVDSVLSKHAQSALRRLAIASYELDKSGTFATKYLYVCAGIVRKEAVETKQTSELATSVMALMVSLAAQLLERGHSSAALIPVIVAREAAQKGLNSPPPNDQFFNMLLFYFPKEIKRLGQKAISIRDVNFMYQCLDAMAWLGCSALKKEHVGVGKACIQGLVQLGRESRAANLESIDHAHERLTWIISCIPSLPESKQDYWLRLTSEAFSRLHGKKFHTSLEIEDDKQMVFLNAMEEPHKVSHLNLDQGQLRTVDYSDPTFIKEQELY